MTGTGRSGSSQNQQLDIESRSSTWGDRGSNTVLPCFPKCNSRKLHHRESSWDPSENENMPCKWQRAHCHTVLTSTNFLFHIRAGANVDVAARKVLKKKKKGNPLLLKTFLILKSDTSRRLHSGIKSSVICSFWSVISLGVATELDAVSCTWAFLTCYQTRLNWFQKLSWMRFGGEQESSFEKIFP